MYVCNVCMYECAHACVHGHEIANVAIWYVDGRKAGRPRTDKRLNPSQQLMP